ncbi:MAG: DNA repair protein RecO C-terminal domain-containing protein, partial [Anaerolineae bacterium]|nr:DNA repair protein RecO C-terminal domain-containing protein [Anaerolineae bacterium]
YVGYRPELFRCVRCERPLGESGSFFGPADGGVLCLPCGQGERNCREVSAQSLAALRYLQTKDLELCRRLRIDGRVHFELESLLRAYIIHLLERGLRSADFLDTLRRQEAKLDAREVTGV